jgi:ferredoxin
LSASLFNLNLSGLLDPIAILLRGLTFLLHPLMGLAAREGWVALYRLLGERRDFLAPAYNLFHDNLLPFRDTIYPLALLSAVILLGVIALERFETRNWCRNLCPLGTLLGWLGRLSPFKRVPAGLCADCGACRELCPTSFEQDRLVKEECVLCMDCQRGCSHERISFRPALTLKGAGPLLPERRVLLGGRRPGCCWQYRRDSDPPSGCRGCCGRPAYVARTSS